MAPQPATPESRSPPPPADSARPLTAVPCPLTKALVHRRAALTVMWGMLFLPWYDMFGSRPERAPNSERKITVGITGIRIIRMLGLGGGTRRSCVMEAKFPRPEEGERQAEPAPFFPAAIKQGRGSRGGRRALPLPAAAAPSRLQVGAGFARLNPGSGSFPPVPHPYIPLPRPPFPCPSTQPLPPTPALANAAHGPGPAAALSRAAGTAGLPCVGSAGWDPERAKGTAELPPS